MSLLDTVNWLYAASGLAVGLLVGFTGVGGGSLMTPLLVLLFGIHPATAVGTDLLYAGITKSSGTVVHGWNKTVDWAITARLATGSVPATVITLLILSHLGQRNPAVSHMITTTLGFALLLTAATLLGRRWLLKALAGAMSRLTTAQTTGLTILLGAILGVLVSVSSVGAGAIGVTALILLYPTLPTVRIVGSDIAHAVPLTLIAGAGHWFMGSVDWALLASLLVGSIPGIVVGSYFAGRIPDYVLRPALASTLALVGAKLSL